MPRAAQSRRRPGRAALLVTLAAVALAVPAFVEFYTDWLWFGEVGYRQVFTRTLSAKLAAGAAVGVAVFALLYANLAVALRRLPARRLRFETREGPLEVSFDAARFRPFIALGTAAVAVLAALVGSGQWLAWLAYLHATPFGKSDPIFDRDVAFYLFELPLLQALQHVLRLIVMLALIGVGVIYYLAGEVTVVDGWRPSIPRAGARRHVAALATALFLVLAFGAWLGVPALLTSPGGVLHGATYTDIQARVPALRLLLGAALAGAALAGWQAVVRTLWPLGAAVGLYVLVALGGAGYAMLVQRLVVAPNEQVKETPYIVHNIAATRDAFGLNGVEERELSGDALLTRGDIDANGATLKNVRLWDHQPLLDTFGQIQEIRTYYDFVSVDNDRYVIDGEYRQIMLSGRELNSASLPNRAWINERLTFTHGYGLTLGPVNQVTPEGLPVLFIKNLPPESAVNLPVSQPAIYFGELTSGYVFVRTRAREFHYPKGEDNVYSRYDGDGGVPIGGWLNKLLFAIRFRSLKVLLSDDITAESRALFHRQLDDRIRRVAPFLEYDADPYLVISKDGRLFWMQDAYTVSRSYPYSTPLPGGINYMRNAVKATVDAYHGTIRFYQADAGDPVARTLDRIFPGLLRPLAEMPADLRGHVRYPEDIFRAQAAMYATYHMENPAVFYNKEDQWNVPSIERGDRETPMQPYYTIMKLPGESSAEFIQMLPFTPARKDNLAAWLVARSDGEHYGRLLVFQFPKQKVIFGPRQVVGRINQDQAIAPQINLWNQQGSEVIQGTLLVIPIEESLIYIRPLYLRASGGRIPELKRVIVAYENRIVMEETLDEALDRLFPRAGAAAQAKAPQPPEAAAVAEAQAPAVTDLAARAREHYRRAIEAQRNGDWARYGEEIRQLGAVLEQMAKPR